MAQAEYLTVDAFKAAFGILETADDAIILTKIQNASNGFEQVTGRTYARVAAVDEIIRKPHVQLGRDGVLRVRTRVPRITAVTSLAFRVGTPAASWLSVGLDVLDWGADEDFIRAYTSIPGRGDQPLWAKMSYVAGYVGDGSDPYPGDLVECVMWWANWLYRTKDAPMEKTANPMLGTVTIPSAMPSRIKLAVQRWSYAMVA